MGEKKFDSKNPKSQITGQKNILYRFPSLYMLYSRSTLTFIPILKKIKADPPYCVERRRIRGAKLLMFLIVFLVIRPEESRVSSLPAVLQDITLTPPPSPHSCALHVAYKVPIPLGCALYMLRFGVPYM
jgi:hypothetical protein